MIRFARVLTFFCATTVLLSSGCMSMGMKTDLMPASDPALASPAGIFYIAALKCENEMRDRKMSANASAKQERVMLPMLRRECAERYPALFTGEPANAIPLAVEMNTKLTMHDGKMMAWMFCTLTVVGVIFPCPADSDEDWTIGVSAWNGREVAKGAGARNTFRRENHMWLSLLTPLGLIHVPGESDFPKTSATIFDIAKIEGDVYKHLVPQTATALAQLVAAQDPSYWTAQPGVPASTAAPSAAPAVPMVLPPPPESTAPF